MASCRIWFSLGALGSLLLLLLLFVTPVLSTSTEETSAQEAEGPSSAVFTLVASNFSDFVSKHPFVVVEFYASWCGHCKNLAPEYEKAATVLSKHDPPIILAKIDGDDLVNRELTSKYEIKGFPTLKIFRNGGESIGEYKGPREADGIIHYLKKEVGPASAEVRSSHDGRALVDNKRVSVVGIFPQFSGEEFENFIKVAKKLRSDFDFGHTLDASLLPRGGQLVKTPVVRLFKPFDELVVDFEDFDVDRLEKFIESTSVPVVAIWDQNPDNQASLLRFFNSPSAKAMLFLNFDSDDYDTFESKLREVAEIYKEKDLGFLIGNLDVSQNAFQYFGLREEQTPLIIIQEIEGKRFLQPNVEPDQISTWLADYVDGKLKPFRKSEPIPEDNSEPVKVAVADNLHVLLNSGKNVLLEFYAPWCGHCKKLAPILEEVAVSFQNDADVIIAKMDATANDLPSQFPVTGYPTLYFYSASGKISRYDGGRTRDDIISFLQENKESTSQSDSADTVKDEL